jgi:hypothetical protein
MLSFTFHQCNLLYYFLLIFPKGLFKGFSKSYMNIDLLFHMKQRRNRFKTNKKSKRKTDLKASDMYSNCTICQPYSESKYPRSNPSRISGYP